MGVGNKRSIKINGRPTGICVEGPFWKALKEIASKRSTSLSGLVAEIDGARQQPNLSSAIRLYVLEHYRSHTELKSTSPRT
jgi:predicted DNA-binding ribbon-helix-helix protein